MSEKLTNRDISVIKESLRFSQQAIADGGDLPESKKERLQHLRQLQAKLVQMRKEAQE